jgi:hypothetical protein
MVEANSAIAIIPSDCFRWRARVQFIESFRTQAAALNYAFEHGHNLIVERNEGSSQLFDVIEDPDGACTADLKLELLTNEEVLVEPENPNWTLLLFLTLWNLAKRFGATMARVCSLEIASRVGQAATRQRWSDIQRFLRLAWYRHAHWGIRNLRRQFGAAISFYRSEIAPRCRHAASRCWWSGRAVDFRRWLHRHSQGDFRDLVKRLAAVTASTYSQEIAPRLRQAAIRMRQADYNEAVRRAWSTSIMTVSIRAPQLAAAIASLYQDKVFPALRHAAIKVRQADFEGAIRRAWSITILTAIRLVDHFFAAVAGFYVRELTPRMRRAAERYQQAEIEEGLRRSIGAVATPSHSNSSQLV